MGEDDIIIQENKHFEKMQFRLKVATNFLYILVPLSLGGIGLILFLLIANRVQNSETTGRLLVIYGGLTAMAMAGILPIIIIFILIQSYYIHKIKTINIEQNIRYPKIIRIIGCISILCVIGFYAFFVISARHNKIEQERPYVEQMERSKNDQEKNEERKHARYIYLQKVFAQPITSDQIGSMGEWRVSVEQEVPYDNLPGDITPYYTFSALQINGIEPVYENISTFIFLGKKPEWSKQELMGMYGGKDGEFNEVIKNTLESQSQIVVQLPPEDIFLKTYEIEGYAETFQAKIIGETGVVLNDFFGTMPVKPYSEVSKEATEEYKQKYANILEPLIKKTKDTWLQAKYLPQYQKLLETFEEPQTIISTEGYQIYGGDTRRVDIVVQNSLGEKETVSLFNGSIKAQKTINYINDNLIGKKATIILIDQDEFTTLLGRTAVSSGKELFVTAGTRPHEFTRGSITIQTDTLQELYVPSKIYVDGELLNDKFE